MQFYPSRAECLVDILCSRRYLQARHQQFYGVLPVLGQGDRFVEVYRCAIDASVLVAIAQAAFKDFSMRAFVLAHDWGQQAEAGTCGQGSQPLCNL